MTFFNPTIASLYWNPPKEVFRIPLIDHPIAWYGVFFVLGFVLAYFVVIKLIKNFLLTSEAITETEAKNFSISLSDKLCWFTLAGTLIGARLGAILLYDWPYFKSHPEEMIKVWHGGLASHGGVIGVVIALIFYFKTVRKQHPSLTFLSLMDIVSIPSALVATFIRIGNFINQEIVGTPSSLPWAVLFAHPSENVIPIPRHPVQLYEALCYLSTFFILYYLARKKKWIERKGALCGLMFVLIFTSRFILEFWKERQISSLDFSVLQMGQWLSIPFILGGMILLYIAKQAKKAEKLQEGASSLSLPKQPNLSKLSGASGRSKSKMPTP